MQYKVKKLPDGSSKKRIQKIEDTLQQEALGGWKLHSMTNQTILGFTESMLAVFYNEDGSEGHQR